MQKKYGFTLIEMLVVIIIIVVFLTMALPLYDKAVAEARSVQLQTLLRNAADASKSYYMTHGKWPSSFDSLSIGMNLPTLPGSQNTCDNGNLFATSVKRGDGFELTLYNATGRLQHNFISAHFTDGKYKCSGFVHYNYNGAGWGNLAPELKDKTFCAEYLYNRNCGEYNCKIFCDQVMGKKFKKYVQLINIFE